MRFIAASIIASLVAPKLTSGPSPALAMVYLAAGDVDRADELVESGIRLVGENGLDITIW